MRSKVYLLTSSSSSSVLVFSLPHSNAIQRNRKVTTSNENMPNAAKAYIPCALKLMVGIVIATPSGSSRFSIFICIELTMVLSDLSTKK